MRATVHGASRCVPDRAQALCHAQFEMLASTIGAARCAVYFRREHPTTGSLEFMPVAVFPETQSVWVVGQDGDLPAVGLPGLPGGCPSPDLIPHYPFINSDDSSGLPLEDGSMSFPLATGSVVRGVLTVWRSEMPWTQGELAIAAAGARSLSMGAALDQRSPHDDHQANAAILESLADAVHQLNGPPSAVLVLSKLLLRRLAEEDGGSRRLVREIMSQASRMSDLLQPLDMLSRGLSLPTGGSLALMGLTSGTQPLVEDGTSFVWVQDVLAPLLLAFEDLTTDSDTTLAWELEDMPPVTAQEAHLREASFNLLDNARLHGMGLVAVHGAYIDNDVRVEVWNPTEEPLTSDQLEKIFDRGYQARAGEEGSKGSGLGLCIARDLVHAMGGQVSADNAPCPAWLQARAAREGWRLSGFSVVMTLPRARLE